MERAGVRLARGWRGQGADAAPEADAATVRTGEREAAGTSQTGGLDGTPSTRGNHCRGSGDGAGDSEGQAPECTRSAPGRVIFQATGQLTMDGHCSPSCTQLEHRPGSHVSEWSGQDSFGTSPNQPRVLNEQASLF